jgi:hypothetical protein
MNEGGLVIQICYAVLRLTAVCKVIILPIKPAISIIIMNAIR